MAKEATLDDLTTAYNYAVLQVPPGSPVLIDLQKKIQNLEASQTAITESLAKTSVSPGSSEYDALMEYTAKKNAEAASSGGGDGFNIGPFEIGGVIGDFLGEAAKFVDNTVDDVFDFPKEKYTKDLLKASPSIENLIR